MKLQNALIAAALLSSTALVACAKKTDGTSPDASASPSALASSPPVPMMQPPPPPQVPAPADVAAAPADAQKTASGLVTKVEAQGTGTVHPSPKDKVTVNYTGWTKDGKTFDSSIPRGQPAVFEVDQLIAGWTEGLQLMVQGEKRRMWVPSALAYGDSPKMHGAPAGDLTFDVELLDIKVAPPPPPVPTDVAAAPASAKKTASGLQYRVLVPAKDPAAAKPSATSVVSVNYSGWTTDGKMFDSSVTRGQPATFPLNRVIPGWTEGLQLMKVGEKDRFWIPGALAYDTPGKPSRPGAPHGTLVFDVELLSIQPGQGGPPMMPPSGGNSSSASH
jgi:FKBP-type peptidyl-prolyl cis-trans isomerase